MIIETHVKEASRERKTPNDFIISRQKREVFCTTSEACFIGREKKSKIVPISL